MKKTLFIMMVAMGMQASAAMENLTLPQAGDYVWVPGSNASGLTTAPTAELVAQMAAAIVNPSIGNTDTEGWFGGTGQGYNATSTYGSDVTINSADSFTFTKRPALSQEYVMMGVSVSGGANAISFSFTCDNTVGYSLWGYDADTGTATQLVGYTEMTATGSVSQELGALSADVDTIFMLWGTTPINGGGGSKSTVTNITLALDTVGAYYWGPAADGAGVWTAASWLEDNAGSAIVLPTGAKDVIFDNAAYTAAQVSVSSGAVAANMSIKNGTYTFKPSGTDAVELVVEGKLSVSGGSATFEHALRADNVELTAGNLNVQSLSVGDSATDVFSMSGGSLKANQIIGNGKVQITGGTVELTQGSTASGGMSISGATLVGNTVLSGATAALSVGSVTVDADSVSISDASLSAPITVTSGSLSFGGNVVLAQGSNAFVPTASQAYSEASGNGYLTTTNVYTVVTGDTSQLSSSATWYLGTQTGTWSDNGTVAFTTGEDASTYWVRNGSVAADATWEQGLADKGTGTIMLDGGTLSIEKEYESTALLNSSATGGTVYLGADGVLHRDSVAQNAAAIKLSGEGVYELGGAYNLHGNGGVSLSNDWTGTVNVGDIESTSAVALSGVANASSCVRLGRVDVTELQLGSQTQSAGRAEINFLALSSGDSVINAAYTEIEHLYLGSADAAATLTVNGELNLTQGAVTLEHEKSALTAERLADGITSINFVMDSQLLTRSTGESVLLTLTDPDADYVDVQLTLNGNSAEQRVAEHGSKHAYTLAWDEQTHAVMLHSVLNPRYVTEKYATAQGNAAAGARMLNAAFVELNPQNTAPASHLAKLLDAVDANALSHDSLAAIAGSSISSLGMALAGDAERQLRAIRNRTTTMGVSRPDAIKNGVAANIWFNAEGNHAELDQDGQYPGYTLDNWGGTVGMDFDVSKHLTMGVALTAMYGDFSTSGPDMADGNMDMYYVSFFGRYVHHRFTHTLVASVGMMESSVDRTVSYAGGSYSTSGNTDGMAFGFLYEVGRAFALDEENSVCFHPVFNITYRHISVGGYEEGGSGINLRADDQTLDMLTLGLGARFQADAGENIFNRKGIFEARVLAKADVGDRCSTANVAILNTAIHDKVESAELGVFGVEVGAGITVPVGLDGAFFIDASAEFRSGYNAVNATVGYRTTF